MLKPTRGRVIAQTAELEAAGVENPERALCITAGQQFCNRHRLRFHQLLDDAGNIAAHPRSDSDGYSCRCIPVPALGPLRPDLAAGPQIALRSVALREMR